jgi:hypothetical protein
MNLEYIVTGTGRCGTLYMANLLTSCGITCSHEGIFTNKGLNKAFSIIKGEEQIKNSKVSETENMSNDLENFVADSSYMSAPFLSHFQKSKIIHVVRNPFKVVSSFINFGYFLNASPTEQEENPFHLDYEQFIYNHIHELSEEMNQIDRAFLYYVNWNEMIEKNKIDLFYKIEEPENKVKNFLNKIDGDYDNKKCNHKGETKKLNLNMIENKYIKQKVKKICQKYNYSILY